MTEYKFEENWLAHCTTSSSRRIKLYAKIYFKFLNFFNIIIRIIVDIIIIVTIFVIQSSSVIFIIVISITPVIIIILGNLLCQLVADAFNTIFRLFL